jgi:tetratricopeptide (TPR) repeat protein
MASIVNGYEYDIFISYRQKDNKYNGWVTEFVDNLKRELEATFKEDISVYFDINPHDGLLETHDVDASLKEKLKCLVFIPIISRTYCDPKSFAWEHEFVAFVEQASKDQFGLKVKLPNGNVANRVLPVRIHDLDKDDIKLCESVLGGVLRGVEFIYKEPGVNKPLTSEDDENKNLNKTKYRIQINKIANAIKEIVSGLIAGEVVAVKEKEASQLPRKEAKKEKKIIDQEKPAGSKKRKLLSGIVAIVFLAVLVAIYAYPKIIKRDPLENLRSSGNKISIAVMPFQNLTDDTACYYLQETIQMNLISALTGSDELRVRQKETITEFLKTKGQTQDAPFSLSLASAISKKLDADIFIYGNIQKAGSTVRLNVQLINTNTDDVLKSIEIDGPYEDENIIHIIDSLRRKVTDFLLISKLIKENPWVGQYPVISGSPDAYRYFIYGARAASNAVNHEGWATARDWFLRSLAADSNFFYPMNGLIDAYKFTGKYEESLKWVLKVYQKRSQWPVNIQIDISWIYACAFGSLEEQVKYLNQSLQIDDQSPDTHWLLGEGYREMNQFEKAITELEKAIELQHQWGVDYSWYYLLLGKAYHKTGQIKKEKALYKKAEKFVKDDNYIIGQRAILSLSEKDTVRAKGYIEKYSSFCKENSIPEAEIAQGIADIYWEAGIPDKAENYYRKAVALEPDNPALLNLFAVFLHKNKGNPLEFSSIIDKAIRLAPSKWDYYNYSDTKGYGLFELGKPKEALDILQKTWDEIPFKVYFIKSHLEEVKRAIADKKLTAESR